MTNKKTDPTICPDCGESNGMESWMPYAQPCWDCHLKRIKAHYASVRKCAKTTCDRPATKSVRTFGYWERLCNEHADEWPWTEQVSWDHAIESLVRGHIAK